VVTTSDDADRMRVALLARVHGWSVADADGRTVLAPVAD
jgi:hypothetical protein